jgi:hypothetical protein
MQCSIYMQCLNVEIIHAMLYEMLKLLLFFPYFLELIYNIYSSINASINLMFYVLDFSTSFLSNSFISLWIHVFGALCDFTFWI